MEGFGEKLKNFSRAAIVAAGALLPNPTSDQDPAPQGTEAAQAENQEDQTPAEHPPSAAEVKALEDVVAQMSPEDAVGEVGNPALSFNQSVQLLDKAMTLELSGEDKETVLNVFFMANANAGGHLEHMTGTLDKLREYGIDPENTQWVREYVENVFLENPEEFVPDRTYVKTGADGQVEKIPSTWPECYMALSPIAQHSADPRVHAVIQILENDYEPGQKRRLVYFADDIAEGRISLENAAGIAADKRGWVKKLAEKAVNNPSERLFLALYEAADMEDRASILPTIPNYQEWAAEHVAASDQYAEEAAKPKE